MRKFIILLLLTMPGLTAPALCSDRLAWVDSALNCAKALDYARAELFTRKALQAEPDNPSNHLLFSNLSKFQLAQGKYGQAAESAEIGLVRAPKSSSLLADHALALHALGRNHEALEEAEKALQVDSLQQKALSLSVTILTASSQYDKAQKAAETLMHAYGPTADIHASLGRIAILRGDAPEACARHFKEALKLDNSPDHALHFILNSILAGEDSEAETEINRQLTLHPHSGNFHLLKAVIRKRQFQVQEMELNLQLARQYKADASLIDYFFPGRSEK